MLTRTKLSKMPVLFIGHGSPMNAIEDNEFSRGWRTIAQKLPQPKAVLCISAHWITQKNTATTSEKKLKTIHDFYGFPEELNQVQYPAVGDPVLAKRISECITKVSVKLSTHWGLDHGAWSVLKHLYPNANIPVLQLSIDYDLPLEVHYEVGKELVKLREEGVLIIGSGNIVHNLHTIALDAPEYSWAKEFDEFVKKSLLKHDTQALIEFQKQPTAGLAHPTYDHYLPLLYVVGAAGNEKPVFFNERIVMGSISMRCVGYGL